MEAGLIDDAVVAESLAQSQTLWHLRESIPLAQAQEGATRQARHRAAGVGHSRLRSAHRCRAGTGFSRYAPGNFGHLGDGNLHFNVHGPAAAEPGWIAERAAAITALVHDLVTAAGGSISAEHGIGVLKRADLAATQVAGGGR